MNDEFTYKGGTYTHEQVAKKKKVISKNGWQCRIWRWTLGDDVRIPGGYCPLFWASLLFALFSWLTLSIKSIKSFFRFLVTAITPTEDERKEKEEKEGKKRFERYLNSVKIDIVDRQSDFNSAQQIFANWAPGAVLTEEEFQKIKEKNEAVKQKQLKLEAAQKIKEAKREARRKYYAEIAAKVAKRLQPYTEKLLNFKDFVMHYSKPIVLLIMLIAIGFIGYWSIGLLKSFAGWVVSAFWLIVQNWWVILKVIFLTALSFAALAAFVYSIIFLAPKIKEKFEETEFNFSESKLGQIAQKGLDIVVAIFSALKTVFSVLCETFTMLYKKECPLVELSDGPSKPIEKRPSFDGM